MVRPAATRRESTSMGEKWMKFSKTACGFFAFLHEIVF